MKKYKYIIVFLVLSLSAASICNQSESGQPGEYRLKAAYLYNFIRFADWPARAADSNDMKIAIISSEPLVVYFEPLKDKKVKNKKVLIRQLPSFEKIQQLNKTDKKEFARQIESMKSSHILFISSSESAYIKDILSLIKNTNVMTVGETSNFLDDGGIINFLTEDNKLCFEINLEASDKAKIEFSSQLLQLARRIVKAKDKP